MRGLDRAGGYYERFLNKHAAKKLWVRRAVEVRSRFYFASFRFVVALGGLRVCEEEI